MDIAEAMKLFEDANPDAAKIVQGKLTEVNGEAGANRKKAVALGEEKENLLGLLGEIAKSLGVEDVKEVPTKVTETSTEMKALMNNVETLSKRLDEKDAIIERGTIKKDLTSIFEEVGFSDAEYHAELYAEKAKKGETGIMIGDKFAKDMAKSLGEKHPSFLSKEIKAPNVKTETKDDVDNNVDTKKFTIDDIKNMTPEDREKNKPAIIAQAKAEEKGE